MKYKFSTFVISAMVIFLLCLYVSCNEEKIERNNESYSIKLNEYGLNSTLKFNKYGIQNIFTVPDITITGSDESLKILSYRTEFHNGTENGVLKVYSKLDSAQIIPFFVLEELFYVSKNLHYKRLVSKVTSKNIKYALYKVEYGKQEKILEVELAKENGRFKIVELNELKEGFKESAIFFSDSYSTLQKKLLSSKF